MSNSGQQRSAYVEAHAAAHAAVQQHMVQQAGQVRPGHTVPQPVNPTFTLPDDGLGYDDGVRVLRTIGTWYAKYPESSTIFYLRNCFLLEYLVKINLVNSFIL